MITCKKCHVQIQDETDICPLCHSVVDRDDEPMKRDNYYPDIAMKAQKLRLVMRIYIFCAVLIESALVILTYLQYDTIFWHYSSYSVCLLPAGMMLCGYFMLSWVRYGTRTSYAVDIMFILVALVCFVDLADRLIGSTGLGMNYVQPALFATATILILVLIIFNKRSWQTFIYIQVGVLVLSLIAIPLTKVGHLTHPMASWVVIGWSVIQTFGFLVIGGSRVKEELVRRFHIN